MLMDMDTIFQVFRLADLQTCRTIKLLLDRYDISWEDFEKWLKTRILQLKGTEQIIRAGAAVNNSKGCKGCDKRKTPTVMRGCKDCDTNMLLFDVNTTSCNQVGGSLTRQWICPKCGREDFE